MTAPKPKPQPAPEPEPDPPEPGPDDEPEAEPNPDVNDNLHERIDAIFASQVALIDRVDKLEERVAAPPIPYGKRP